MAGPRLAVPVATQLALTAEPHSVLTRWPACSDYKDNS